MNVRLVDSLIQIIQTLSVTDRKLLDSKLATLRRSSQFQQWDQISDAEAAALKAEFAQEDVALCYQIVVLDRQRLIRRLGTLSQPYLEQLNKALRYTLQLDDLSEETEKTS